MPKMKTSDGFKVSVIVPVYNTAEYLPECLDSLVGQSIGLDSIQIVVVNDGSTDDSAEVIKSYAERFHDNFVCLEQANSGQGVARNFGLSRCEGEYIGFMDSDDFADADMYRAMYEAARSADADMCVCGIDGFCDKGERRFFGMQSQLPLNPTTQESLFLTPQTQPPIRLIRRELLMRYDVRFPATRGSEDNGFHFKLAPYCLKVVSVQEQMVKRRLRRESTAVSISPSFCEQFFSVMNNTFEFYSEHGLLEDYGELLEAAFVRMLLCSRLGCVGLVKDSLARKGLLDKTMAYIEANFPNRRDNRYLKGFLGMYLKRAGPFTVGISKNLFAWRYRRRFVMRL